MDAHERRQMILARQHLTDPADVQTVCRDLNGIQSQFASYARHALATRCRDTLVESWGDGLVKAWTVRGTMHIFRAEDLPLFLHRDRQRFLRDVDRLTADPFAALERKQAFAAFILDCVDRSVTKRDDLRAACRTHGMTEQEERSFFDGWGGLLRAMTEEGLLCYAAEEDKTFRRCLAFTPMDREEALLEQTRRYFAAYGPATVRDAAYYFGVSQREIKGRLDRLPVTAVSCEGKDCFFLDDGQRDYPDVPACILLAGFDPLMLGFEKRDGLFLESEHLRRIFNLSGIVLPCVLLDGKAAGRWKRSGKRVTVESFRSFRVREKKAVEREIRRWFPDTASIVWEEI